MREIEGIPEIIDQTSYLEGHGDLPTDKSTALIDLTKDESDFAKDLMEKSDFSLTKEEAEFLTYLIKKNDPAIEELRMIPSSTECTIPLKPPALEVIETPVNSQTSLARLIYYRGFFAIQRGDREILLDSLKLLSKQALCHEIQPNELLLQVGVQIERIQLGLIRAVIQQNILHTEEFSFDYEEFLLKTNLHQLLKIDLAHQGVVLDQFKEETLTSKENPYPRFSGFLVLGHPLGGAFKWLTFSAESYKWKYSEISPYIDKKFDEDGFIARQHRIAAPFFLEAGATLRATSESRELVRIALQLADNSTPNRQCKIPPPTNPENQPFVFPQYIRTNKRQGLCVLSNPELVHYPSLLSIEVSPPISRIEIPWG